MMFAIQIIVFAHEFWFQLIPDNRHHEVFHEFGETVLALIATPQPKLRIRTLPV